MPPRTRRKRIETTAGEAVLFPEFEAGATVKGAAPEPTDEQQGDVADAPVATEGSSSEVAGDGDEEDEEDEEDVDEHE
jgi:hypothetical protein